MRHYARKAKQLTVRGDIAILCEGETEYFYVKHITQNLKKIQVYCLDGGGYRSLMESFPKFMKRYEVLLLVCDLDRAANIPGEVIQLNRMIEALQKINIKNNIFLSYENIEYWFACCIGESDNKFSVIKCKGYKKGKDAVTFLKEHDGSYERGKSFLMGVNPELYYFYKIRLDKKVSPKKENVARHQSTMWYFLDYIKLLQS